MMTIRGVVRNGLIVPDDPLPFEEEERITLLHGNSMEIADSEDRPDTPEELADWLEKFDSIEYLQMSDDELNAWANRRAAQKEFELSLWKRNEAEIRGLFE